MLNFRKVNDSDAEKTLKWRINEQVTRYMFTDIDCDISKQQAWIKYVNSDLTQRNWIIQYDGIDIGLISISQINDENKSAYLGFYIGELEYSAITGRIFPYLYNYIFFELGLNKFYAEVMQGNNGMMKLHRYYGYKHILTKPNYIYKYGAYHDVESYELTKEVWLNQFGNLHVHKATFD